jgi:hypothetical protein
MTNQEQRFSGYRLRLSPFAEYDVGTIYKSTNQSY